MMCAASHNSLSLPVELWYLYAMQVCTVAQRVDAGHVYSVPVCGS